MPNRRYTLGPRSLRLASGWIDRLLQVASAPMRRIADSCGETVYLLQLVGFGGRHVGATRWRSTCHDRRRSRAELSTLGPAAGRAFLSTLSRAQGLALLPAEPFPAFTPRTKTTWADVSAAVQEGRRSGIHAEQGEIDPFLSCYATPLQQGERDEKLALAVSFEAVRPEGDRRLIRQALQREWREFALYV